MKTITINSDEVLRTELIKLSFEQRQIVIVDQLQEEVRQVTNHMIRSKRDVVRACVAYALKHGLVDGPPVFPNKPSLPKPVTDSEKQTIKEAWKCFNVEKKKVAKQYGVWLAGVFKAVKGIPECGWREDDYKSLRKIYGKIGSAVLYRDTVLRVKSTKRGKEKHGSDHIPLVWANAPLVETGEFYGLRRGKPYYNARISIPMAYGHERLVILGRLRRPLPGSQVQGISLFKEADGWYAAVKCIVKRRLLPEPSFPPVGVDVGQTDLVALSDGYKQTNSRNVEFLSKKAAIQEMGDKSDNLNFRKKCWDKVARMDQHERRKVKYWLDTELLPKLDKHEFVFIENLPKGFRPANKKMVSYMKTILSAIRYRLGDLDNKEQFGPKSRVRAVEYAYTSQICSCCENSTDIVRIGKYFSCLAPNCMATLDADTNAAKNILTRGLQVLASEGVSTL